jgi:hypothetical protein
MFDLRVFLRAHFQERNYRVNREVAVILLLYNLDDGRSPKEQCYTL